MKRNLFLMGVSVLLLTSCAKQLPFLRSVTGNVNVYKTRTDLKVRKAYNPKTGLPEEDDKTAYILSPGEGNYLRYSLLNDTIKDIIRILPVVAYQGNKIVFDEESSNTDRISDYFFNMPKRISNHTKSILQAKSSPHCQSRYHLNIDLAILRL